MRRTETLCLAVALATLAGCTSNLQPRGRGVTSLLVVNNTDRPIQVTYSQNPLNTQVTAVQVDQQVYPDDSVRFSGKKGDRITVTAGDETPLVVEYGRRSHVLNVSGAGPDVAFDLHRGFNESEVE
ncbi:MAG TPA: hypothetical protein VFF69_04855 [Phycisphaerales bacterium]|nr:hypothetical protein [Phycisphaerales bacterium]